MTIGCHIGWHVPLTRGKKWKKCHLQQSSLLSIKYSIIKSLWLIDIEKSCFWPKCLIKQKSWWIILSYNLFILLPQYYTKISHITSLLKYISHFSYSMTCMAQAYSSPTKSSSFVEFFWRELIKLSSQLFKSPQSLQYCHQVWSTHLVKVLKCRKLYSMATILGDSSVLVLANNMVYNFYFARFPF